MFQDNNVQSEKRLDKRAISDYTYFEAKNVQSGGKMGVVYKLKSEVTDFILEKKKEKPLLSCRALGILVEEKFKIKISKSSINTIIKVAGLSMPVGRRLKKRRPPALEQIPPPPEIKTEVFVKPEIKEITAQEHPSLTYRVEPVNEVVSGAILLKAADYLVGGSYEMVAVVGERLKSSEPDLERKVEALIYSDLQSASSAEVTSYLNILQEVKVLGFDIFRIINRAFQEVRGIKVSLSDGQVFFIDGQLNTIWSTPYIPPAFSTTLYNIKGYIKQYFRQNQPFLLLMAPGYEMPGEEFFDFMLGLEGMEKYFSRLTLYGNKFEELEVIDIDKTLKRFFVFGLWPWQFGDARRLKTMGEFVPFTCGVLKQDFYLARVELDLMQPDIGKRVRLRGAAVKTSPNEKTRLVILSNLPAENFQPEQLVENYLQHWPNFSDTFADFSRKVELSTYAANNQPFFSLDSLNLDNDAAISQLKVLFSNYLKALDLYVKWHFFPAGYENKDWEIMRAQFYDLKAILKSESNQLLVTLQPPVDYPFLKDLEYACRRINEREIRSPAGKRIWLFSA